MIRLVTDNDDPPRRHLDVFRYDSPHYTAWAVWSAIIGGCLLVWLGVILLAVAVFT